MSSFGQAFLISLFGPYFFEGFSLSNATFSSLYSTATLVSAGLLPCLGKWIDDLPLRTYSQVVAAGLLMGSITVALSWHLGLMLVGMILLRLSRLDANAALQEQKSRLQKLERAQKKLYDGKYGICGRCDDDIPLGRLKFMPWTARCAKCAQKL